MGAFYPDARREGSPVKPTAVSLFGGCYCRAVRYKVQQIYDAGYCHCTICRRITGAPVFAWVNVPMSAFRIERGKTESHASSKQGKRFFCSRCGSYLYGRTSLLSDVISLSVGTLDMPEAVEPRVHHWCAEKLAWYPISDRLPRLEKGDPKHPKDR